GRRIRTDLVCRRPAGGGAERGRRRRLLRHHPRPGVRGPALGRGQRLQHRGPAARHAGQRLGVAARLPPLRGRAAAHHAPDQPRRRLGGRLAAPGDLRARLRRAAALAAAGGHSCLRLRTRAGHGAAPLGGGRARDHAGRAGRAFRLRRLLRRRRRHHDDGGVERARPRRREGDECGAHPAGQRRQRRGRALLRGRRPGALAGNGGHAGRGRHRRLLGRPPRAPRAGPAPAPVRDRLRRGDHGRVLLADMGV
ncbi:MAG: Uncharacterized UPF0721 integral membrane protein, partial [uncultured Acetobacteraceae bacterium]